MRKWAILLLLWGIAWPAMADKTMSIEQMEQLLIKLHGKPDGKVAGELEDVQLTERVIPARLARWEADFPGKRTQEELMKLADMTAFLNPPASDVLRDPPPDADTEERMLALAVDYVRLTTARLPDFYATRETTHFEDALSHRAEYTYAGSMAMGAQGSLRGLPTQTPGMGSTTEYRGLHSTGEFSMTVTYRDGHEVLDEDAGKRQKEEESGLGLTSGGEFGPILGAVTHDVVHSGVSWLRWEQGNGEPAAVFHYAVAANQSHFRIGITLDGRAQALFPAYHGEIKIDPATGEILRLSEVADMAPPHAAMRAAIVVEYGPVKIGNQTYICPVRGVAFSKVPVPSAGATDEASEPVQVNLNDVEFTHYHEFGSEARMLANASGSGENVAASGGGTPAAETSESSATASAPAALSSSGVAAEPASNAASPATDEASATPASNPALNSDSEAATTPVTGPTANSAVGANETSATSAPAGAISNAPAADTVIHARSRLVVLDVEVTDHDKPVKGLDRSRFHVFEDGHEVPIASFEENEPPATLEIAKAPTLPPDTYSNVPVYPETGAVNVLLLDALNTPASDQEQVRRAMIGYLGTIKPGTSIAVFTLSSRLRMAAGFTTDVAKLLKVLQSQTAKPKSGAGVGSGRSSDLSADLEQAASSINNSGDPGTIWLATQIMQFAADIKAYDTGQRATMTLQAFTELAQYLAAIPGKKNVIWFSGSFPVDLGSAAMAPLAVARVAVYPVDARGLMTVPTAGATYIPPPAFSEPGDPLQGDAASTAVSRDDRAFAVQTSQEKAVMSTIATETGGQVYSTGNDLKAAVEKIMANDLYYYAVSYVPPQTKEGKNGAESHTIEVKVDGAKYQLSYRRGYYTDDGSKPASGSGSAPGAVTAAAMLGAPPSTQILFQARVLPEGDPALTGPMPEKELKNNATPEFKGAPHRYVVDLGVQLEDLTFAEGADGVRSARLEIALVAYDAAGEPVNSLGPQFDLTLPAAQFERLSATGKGVPIRLALVLPSGANVVRAVVYDPASAKTGSLEIPVQVAGAGTVAGANASSK